MKRILVVCTTDSMIWNFLVPHIKELEFIGYHVACACSITGPYFNDLISIYGLHMNEIGFERSPFRVSNFKAFIDLCSLIKKENIDTIFCHEPVGGAMGRLAGKKCGCRVIYMAHGFHFYKGAPKINQIYYWVEKTLSKKTDLLITINQEDYEASLKFYAKKNVKIQGIGVDTSKFKVDDSCKEVLDREFSLPNDAIKILSVGELIPRKNHISIIRAMTKCNRNIYYFIAGEGVARDELKQEIERLHLEDRVFLLGYRTDISQLCNSADIFALPSVQEGLSVALMEAMGCGKPIVASRIRGNVDLIDEGKGGYMCSIYNITGYAKRLNYLAKSKKIRDYMGQYNIAKVKEFDISRIKNQLIDVITSEG